MTDSQHLVMLTIDGSSSIKRVSTQEYMELKAARMAKATPAAAPAAADAAAVGPSRADMAAEG